MIFMAFDAQWICEWCQKSFCERCRRDYVKRCRFDIHGFNNFLTAVVVQMLNTAKIEHEEVENDLNDMYISWWGLNRHAFWDIVDGRKNLDWRICATGLNRTRVISVVAEVERDTR